MRGEPQGCWRSVDRGTCRLGMELRNNRDRSADVVPHGGRQHRRMRYRKHQASAGLRAVSDPRHVWKLHAREPGDPIDARRGRCDGPVGEGREPEVQHARRWGVGRSRSTDEVPEQRWKATGGGHGGQATAPRTQSRTSASSDLLGVREAASRDKRARFTALLHHVTTKLLRGSFYALKRDAAPGVDGVTWQEYETDLERS